MKFNLNSFLLSISYALDMVESEILDLNINHSKRVAYLCMRFSEVLNISKEEKFDLCSLAIMHDNGLTEAALHKGLFEESCSLKSLEDIIEHCPIGEKNIADYPFLTDQKNVILYHHERYDGEGFFGKRNDEIPFLAQVLAFADSLDFKFDLTDYSKNNKELIHSYVKSNINVVHSQEMADLFFALENNTAFWLDMQNETIDKSLMKQIPDISIELPLSEILECTKVFSKIIDSKSKFTSEHTSGLIDKAYEMSNYYNFDEVKRIKFEIAASLHDLGKLAVPNKILDKQSALTDEEYEVIKIHTYFTNYMLDSIMGFQDINNWAYKHHEKLDGSGYPFGLTAEDLSFEERLLGCLDIYQALRENRPYREGLSHDKSMVLLRDSAYKGKIDKDIVEDIDTVFKGS